MNTTSRFHTFVANRLAVINDGSQPTQWRYVPSNLNPADSVTRGLTITDLHDKENRWLQGPKFLWESKDSWPLIHLQPVDEKLLETKKEHQTFLVLNPKEPHGLDKVINYYSCWYKLKKSIAWILRFRRYVTFKSQGNIECPDLKTGSLTSIEVQFAATKVIRHVQRQSFKEAFKSLEVSEGKNTRQPQRKTLRRYLGSLYKLNPVVDNDSMLRVGGRLDKAHIDYNARHPLILHGNHHVTTLIVSVRLS